jgi:predicted permease
LSFVLLVVTGLLLKSLAGMRAASPGFQVENVWLSAIDLSSAGYDRARQRTLQDELIDRVQGMGGVQSASFARVPPFSYRTFSSAPIAIDGYQGAPDEQPVADYDEVSPGYLATLGIALNSGRTLSLTDDESSLPVAVVNEAMAARYWPGLDPVGRTFELKGRRLAVVGVAATVKYGSLVERSKPFFYVPLRQNPSGSVVLHLRTTQPPAVMSAALAGEIHRLDPSLAPAGLVSMREQMDSKSGAQTAALWLVGVFGGLALLLATIGLYGVMSYAVSQSTPELGLRMALGAGGWDLLRLVMRHGLSLTAGGLVIGATTALLTTRLLGDLLYRVGPRDPVAFSAALATMALASLASCALPALRAARTDPLRALRG